jgi:hypothetical protein
VIVVVRKGFRPFPMREETGTIVLGDVDPGGYLK